MALQVPTRLSNENIEAISNYLPYRMDMRKTWSVIEASGRKEYVNTKHFTQSYLKQQENVIQKMMSKMRCSSASPGGVIFMRCSYASPGRIIFYVSVPQKTLIQPFTAAETTKQVKKEMLDGLTLGRTYNGKPCHEVFKTFYSIKKKTRAKWKRIHVFKPEKRSEKSNKRRENEKLDTIQCLKLDLSRIVSGSSSAQRGLFIKQTSTIPLCLANEVSSPYNSGDKSQVMKVFEDSYPHAVSNRLEFPPDWIIMELMMLIHIAPRAIHKTFCDWGEFLGSIYISPWLPIAGSSVCILSDHPKKDSIKSLERQRLGGIDKNQTINERWESVLANAENKRAICGLLR